MVSLKKIYDKLFLNFLTVYRKVPLRAKYIFSFIIHAIIFLSLFFSRPVVGIYLFDYRLGEILILLSLLFSLLILFTPTKYFFELKNNYLIYIYKLVITYFILTLFLRETSILDPYTFRSSSYIWTVSFLFFGYYFLSKFNFDKLTSWALLAILPSIYIISTGNYPNFIIDFFISFSDKFVFIKGSDLTIALISCTLLLNVLLKNEKLKIIYFFGIISLFLPLLLFNSRASFVAATIYLILSLPYFIPAIRKNYIIFFVSVAISIPLFIFSGYRVYGNFSFEKDPEVSRIQEITDTFGGISDQKNTRDSLLFYFEDGRLYSGDPTTDWRLDIWQDVFEDLGNKNLVLKGYGYKEIIPVMKDPSAPGRLGRDGLNENVHNYFVNILARGGLPNVLFFIALHLLLIQTYVKKNSNYKILIYVFPLMLLANFDATMEGVNFPLIFYSFYGYFIRKGL